MFTDKVGDYSLLDAFGVMRDIAMTVLDTYDQTNEGKEVPRGGVYISIFTVDGAIRKDPLGTIVVGSPNEEKASVYRHHCQEKSCRLGSHVGEGHISSYQSSNIPDSYPGAILADKHIADSYILSCSGLPWEYDEAVTAITATKLSLLTMEDFKPIMAISNNKEYLRFTQVVQAI